MRINISWRKIPDVSVQCRIIISERSRRWYSFNPDILYAPWWRQEPIWTLRPWYRAKVPSIWTSCESGSVAKLAERAHCQRETSVQTAWYILKESLPLKDVRVSRKWPADQIYMAGFWVPSFQVFIIIIIFYI